MWSVFVEEWDGSLETTRWIDGPHPHDVNEYHTPGLYPIEVKVRGNFYDVVCSRARPGHYYVRLVRPDRKISVGQVMEGGGSGWMGLPHNYSSRWTVGAIDGFGTRRAAIEYILRSVDGVWGYRR